jgi:hypothetical protein
MWRVTPALVLAGCLVSSACSNSSNGTPTSPTVNPSPSPLSTTATLAPGQRVSLDGTSFAVQFTGVTADSRCPADALCITAGEATAVFEATMSARGGVRLELSTLEARRTTDVGEYRVELRGLDPYPFGSLPRIQPGDYRATIHIAAR